MIRILFDTSGINQLHDDPAGDAIVSGLLATNTVHVSALNVLEAARTGNIARRRSLLQLLKFMTGGDRPLEMPNVLVRRAIATYGRRSAALDLSIDHEADAIWQVLVDSELADESFRIDLDKYHRSLELDFRQCHESARPHFDALFRHGASPPQRPSVFLREWMKRPSLLHDIINPLYRRTVGADLPISEIPELFRVMPEIAGFLLGWGHSIHRRAIAREGYGVGNAGIVDLWFATYLGRVDRFVTADDQQYRALRLIAKILPGRCAVMKYETLQRRLLVTATLENTVVRTAREEES